MRFYKIDSQGPLFLNRGTGTPVANAANEGRMFYEDGNEEIFYADAADWIRMYSENNLSTLLSDINAVGSFIRKDQNDLTTFQLTVDGGVVGDLTGDVFAANADQIVQSGADHLNSSFRAGQVLAANGDTILGMPTAATTTLRINDLVDGSTGLDQLIDANAVANCWWKGRILSRDGNICLDNGANVAASTFGGTATKAKYA